MVRGRLGLAAVVTVLMGCATAESIDGDEGAGGTPSGGSTGSGGKADNPTGGSSAGGAAGSAGSPAGGAPSGGGTSSGGAPSGGASSGGTSSGGSGSGGSGGSCATGQKKCGGVCIAPSPGVGCSLQDDQCTACSPPANATASCAGTLCDFTCHAGYTKSGSTCVGSGGGGSGGGGGGSGGGSSCAAPCDPSKIQDQLICNLYCAPITGKLGLCAPVLNCCTCPS